MANFFYLILFCVFLQSCSSITGNRYSDNFQDKPKMISIEISNQDQKKISLDTFYMRTTDSVYEYMSLKNTKQKKELLQKIISNYINIYLETKDEFILSKYIIAVDQFIEDNGSLEREPLLIHPNLFFKEDK